MFKKALSLLLSMMLVVTSLVVTVVSVNAAGDTYVVAGTENLTGYSWVGVAATAPENVMTENGDGNYEKVFTDVAVGSGYQFKIVKNDTEWFGIGESGNDNFTFNVTKVCDVTVTYNPTTNEMTATGDGVVVPTDLDIDYITAVGNGADAWLNDKNWTVDADANIMEETSEGSKVYQITFKELDAYENYQFKFAANGSWANNWGLPEQGNAPLNEWFDLTYNGQNMIIDTDAAGYEDGYDIVLTLDLSNFNYATKQGAKGKVDIVTGETPTEPATEAPTTVEPTTETPATEPATEAPTTEAATTVAPAKGLTVTATSNLFPEKKVTLSEDQKTIKVTYVFQTKDKDILDFQWFMNYDANVLKPTANTKKATSFEWPSVGSYIFNKAIPGEIAGNATNLSLYDSTSKEIVFASAEFEVIDPSATETTVDLDVQVLRVSKIDPDTEQTITAEESEIMNFGFDQENYDKYVTVCKTETVPDGSEVPTAAPTTAEPTTVAPTTAEPTTVAPTTAEPTTVAPTTVEPTTVAPTTVEPTEAPTTEPATEAPTTEPATEAPTTEPATEAPTTEPAPSADPVYVVAGTEDFAGISWIGDPVNGAANVMTKDGEIYSKTFTGVAAGDNYQLKVVKNVANGTDWDQTWIGFENTDNNLTFNVTSDGATVTVTYDPATNEIGISGDGVVVVRDIDIDYVTAVGNGFENWLNDVSWGVDSPLNMMEQVADKVYKITYKDVASSDSYQFKFAANGSWAANWGLPVQDAAPVGTNFDLVFNGQNMVLDTVALGYEEDSPVDVTLTLDLTDFNYIQGTGAKAFVQVTPKNAVVKATSNICETEGSGTFNLGDKVTVSYILDTKDAQLENVQWALSYDKDLLTLDSLTMPSIDKPMINYEDNTGAASSLELYDFAGGKTLVQATFTVKALGTAVVDLNVSDLTLAKLDAETGFVDEDTEYEAVVDGDIANDLFDHISTEAKVEAYVEPTTTEPVTEEPTTEAPTTEPATEAPTTVEPTTEAPTTEPATEAPTTVEPTEAPTTEPATEAPTTEPATEAPTTVEPTEAPTTVEPATVAPTTPDATSATEQVTTVKPNSTADTPDTPNNNNNSNSPVQTGNASMAIVILLALVSATGVVYFTRKRFTK